MGSHKLVGKSALYDEIVRVPLVVATLGDRLRVRKNKRTSNVLVSGVDLLPTLCDYTGAELPRHCHGHSLRPLVEGRRPEHWPEHVYSECDFYSRMVCTKHYKYIVEYMPNDGDDIMPPCRGTHRVGCEQLFDLAKDPRETMNLTDASAYGEILARHRVLFLNQEGQLDRVRVPHEFGTHSVRNLADKLRRGYGLA